MAELSYEQLKAKYLIKPGDGIESVVPILEGEPTDAYKVLKQNLAIINESRGSYDTPRLHNVNSDVGARKILLDHEDSRNANNYRSTKPIYLYGIVLAWEKNPTVVWVDLPGYSNVEIAHPDDVATNEYDWNRIEHLQFFPIVTGTDAEEVFRGAIAMVQVSSFFPNQIIVDYEGNKFYGLYKYHGVQPFVDIQNVQENVVDKSTGRQMELGVADEAGDTEPVDTDGYGVGYKFGPDDPPVGGYTVTSGISKRRWNPYHKVFRPHYGYDINAPCGTQVKSVSDGTVSQTSFQKDGFGNYVVVTSEGNSNLKIFYAHLSKFETKVGDKVKRGDLLGISGQTGGADGCHLHFEVRLNERRKDPGPYLKRFGQTNGLSGDRQRANLSFPMVPGVMPFKEGFSAESATASQPRNRPKMSLLEVPVDLLTSRLIKNSRGANTLKVREDVSGRIQAIKNYLNLFGVPFSCIKYDVDILNKSLSGYAKVGLEFSLNYLGGMHTESNLNRDDYFIGPDYKIQFGSNYKLKIYGNVKNKFIHDKYKFEEKIIDIYDIKETYLKNKPKIKKIFKTVIDVTKIIEDQGFIQEKPSLEFFNNSNYISSNWYKFYIPLRLEKGVTYREMLETVYDLEKYKNIDIPNLIWDGESFNGIGKRR